MSQTSAASRAAHTMHFPMVMIIALGVSVLIFLALSLQSFLHLDQLFLPDDTYYTLSISRNIARGLGPTTDGTIMTSGFQPLITLLQIPVFWLASNIYFPVRWAVFVSAFFGVVSVGLVGRIVAKAGGSVWAALGAMLFVATSPIIVSNALNGLETSLASALVLYASLIASDVTRQTRVKRLLFLGVICGLALLARIDSVFLVLLIGGGMCLARIGMARVILVAGSAALVVAPWWGWCWAMFGTPIPESGGAVHQIIVFNQQHGFTMWDAKKRAIAALLSIAPSPADALFLGIGFMSLVAITARAAKRRQMNAPALLAIAASALIIFYTVYLPAFWFFDRYFMPFFLAMIIATALEMDRFTGSLRRSTSVLAPLVPALGAIMVFSNFVPLARLDEIIFPDARYGLSNVTGYAVTANDIISDLPDRAVLGAFQSGALGYFTERGIRIVNLDGVVNGKALAAITENKMAAYLLQNKVGYFADWPLNRDAFYQYSGVLNPAKLLTPIARMPPQRLQRFILYRFKMAGQPEVGK